MENENKKLMEIETARVISDRCTTEITPAQARRIMLRAIQGKERLDVINCTAGCGAAFDLEGIKSIEDKEEAKFYFVERYDYESQCITGSGKPVLANFIMIIMPDSIRFDIMIGAAGVNK